MRMAARVSTTAILATILVMPALAAAGEGQKTPSEALFVAELVVLMVTGRLLGELMLRFKQPAVMGQLIAGLVLGPSLFGAILPEWQHALFPKNSEQKAMIDAISQFGILLLLLLTGMETDLRLVRQTGRASVFASLMGIIIPFDTARSGQAPHHQPVPRDCTFDRVGEDRRDGSARDEISAPHRRSGHSRLSYH
jgi:hypothetical protein